MTILNEIFSDVDAVNSPVFDLKFSKFHLAFHGIRTILHSFLVITYLGIHLSHIEQCQRVVLLKFALVLTQNLWQCYFFIYIVTGCKD